MHNWISRPAREQELLDAIECGLAHVVDWGGALDYVSGDMEMLKQIVKLFLEEAPRWMTDAWQAITKRDAYLVKMNAHFLKGGSRLFGNYVYEASLRLEKIGRQGDLTQAAQAYAELKDRLPVLILALNNFTQQSADGCTTRVFISCFTA
jgi:hypothetical protein